MTASKLFKMSFTLTLGGSLNQGTVTATASSEPILKAARLIATFKIKITVVSRKHLGNTHQLAGSSHYRYQ